MENKFYLKIKNIDGTVKVKNFEKTFELNDFNEGAIKVSLSPNNSNNGQAYHGVPHISGPEMIVKNVPGSVSHKLLTKTLQATHLGEVGIYQISQINGEEVDVYHIVYKDPHISYYRYLNGDVALKIGAFSSMETSHTDIDEAGKRKPFVVKHNLQTNKTE